MSLYLRHAATTVDLLEVLPAWSKVKSRREDIDRETVDAILTEAARFAEGTLAPVDRPGDLEGCHLVEGRVRMPVGFDQAYGTLAQSGWLGMDVEIDRGGQGLPLTLHTATQILFDAASTALMMAVGASRAAALLLQEHADSTISDVWIPKLCEGAWTATICISEPDAGSDVGRIRTRAVETPSGWQISGEKIWISYGDHDMATRIGHLLLARTNSQPGVRGLSLFLVPDKLPDGGSNGVSVGRIEEKLGMHASPTCALSFSGAVGHLIGTEGRGLDSLFTMMELMRLQTGAQGLGLALKAESIATAYARDRRQGGTPSAPPPPIDSHGDVRRQLMDLRSRNAVLHMAVLDISAHLDLAKTAESVEERERMTAYAGWMLPMIKTFGAERAFDAAHSAMQVLGGAGYTREWPIEQILRDSRVLAIYEGTTGMQARDFLFRRLWKEDRRGLNLFLEAAASEQDAPGIDSEVSQAMSRLLKQFEELSDFMLGLRDRPQGADYAAEPYLRAAWCAVSGAIVLRMCRLSARPDIAALARYRADQLQAEFHLHATNCHFATRNPDALFEAASDL